MDAIVSEVHLPKNIDPTKATLAYGIRAICRLNEELQSETLLIRQRAVNALCDFLHDHEHIADAISVGAVQSLSTLLKDEDLTVRHKATECLYVMSQHAVARDAFLQFGVIPNLAELFDDSEQICRLRAHQAIEMISETPVGAQGIIDNKLIARLIAKLPVEIETIVELILETLHFCLVVDTTDALASKGMPTFTDLLRHNNQTIRMKAARDIMDLSVPLAGKESAVQLPTVAYLSDLLQDESAKVRCAAAGAIMMIAITTKGKYTAIAADAIPNLLALVDDMNSEVRVNVLKAITCLSEAPEGRKALLPHVDKIAAHMADSIPNVVKHAQIAYRVITWKP